ncbi:MAG: hypothetical protein ACXAEN_20570 [Candidatus Thorarchaeota archaeon]|jgi:hypothetical protein
MTFSYADLIANAAVQSSSRYFEAGSYLVQIDACKVFENRQRRLRAAVECTILDSNNPKLPTTSSVSWVVALDSDSGPGNIKTFIVDMFDCSAQEASNSEKVAAVFPHESTSTPSVACGFQAIVNAYEKETKSGGIFTRVMWKRHDPEKDPAPQFSPLASTVQQSAETAPVSGDPIPF